MDPSICSVCSRKCLARPNLCYRCNWALNRPSRRVYGPIRRKREGHPGPRRFDVTADRILQMKADGYTLRRICLELNVAQKTIYRRLQGK